MVEYMDKMTLLFHTEPFDHQRTVLSDSWHREFFAIFWEQGTGKSKLLLDTARNLWKAGMIDGLLIIAPKGMYMNWVRNEVPKHMPDEDFTIAYHSSTLGTAGKRELDAWLRTRCGGPLDIFVVNVESLSTGSATAACSQFIQNHRIMMAVDESTCIKNIKANRTQAIIKMSMHQNVRYRRIMSGTPITQSPLDIYAQAEFLKRNMFGFCTFFQFRHYYAEMKDLHLGRNRVVKQVVGYKNLDHMKTVLSSFSSRLLKTECLDLPDKLYEVRYIDLTKEQRSMYKELKETAVLQLTEGDVTVTNVMNMLTKLHQVLCGHVKLNDGKYVDLPNNRVQEVLDIAEACQGKLVIWCAYHRDVEQITAALREKYGLTSTVTYYGKTSDPDREEAIRTFTDPNSGVAFWVGTPATGGKGLTLVEASTVVYFSNSHNLEHRLQSEDRTHRIGQLKNVTYIDLVVQDSLDEIILANLKRKQNLADVVLTNWREIIEIGES